MGTSDRSRTRRIVRKILLGVLGLFLCTVLLPQPRALAVMSVSDRVEKKASLLADTGLSVKLPGGLSTLKRDWFPKVLCFEAGTDFGNFAGRPGTRLTVLYNFGSYGFSGHSSLFDGDSPYYNSFYGAYLVQQPEGAFGFDAEGQADLPVMALVPEYDFSRLVLTDFGLSLSDFVFDWDIKTREEGVSLAGYEDWTRLTAELKVNGSAHKAGDFAVSYLQYGVPLKKVDEPFAPVEMQGLLYLRYFPKENVSLFLYGLTCDREALEACDLQFLRKLQVREKDVR